jgi:hypothetical protein
VWGQVDAARRLLSAHGNVRTEDLMGRLPEGISK